jgi:hypothetical protein
MEIHCGKPFLNRSARNRYRHRHLAALGRLSRWQLRRIRDRRSRRHQLPAFNTATDEKINADKHLWRSSQAEAEALW